MPLPLWLEPYDKDRALGLLRYIMHDMPGTWKSYSFGSYGVIISTSDVKILVEPKIVDCYIQRDCIPRPMVSFEIVHANCTAVLQNRFQVWVVDNQGSTKFPLSVMIRQTIAKFLLTEAGDRAIWGGKFNSSIPALQRASREYKESATGNGWEVLPSTMDQVQLALYRSVTVEGFDIPSAKHATFSA